VKLLLSHRADTRVLCNGHSPLSLAIISGNDMVHVVSYCFLIAISAISSVFLVGQFLLVMVVVSIRHLLFFVVLI